MLFKQYVVSDLSQLYKELGRDLLSAGKVVSPRGNETKELISPQIVLTNPRFRLVYNKERKYNIMHALTESIMLHSELDDVEHIGRFNKNMKLFADNGTNLYGAYGKRISKYIPSIVETLEKDEYSRQAVVNIYSSKDMLAKTKDVPCTENLQFMIRDNKLHMITSMRSNDFIFGFQYDVVMFTMLQETIANSLGIDVGNYIHNAGSMHVYKDYPSFNGYEMLEEMGRESTPVHMANDGTHEHWRDLALIYTGNADEVQGRVLSGTVRIINNMINIETLYREIKNGNKNSAVRGFSWAYDLLPHWAQTFLEKYKV